MSATFTTMCPMNCHPTLCGMKVKVAQGAVTITGDADNPDSAGFLCMRGKAAHQIPGNPARLTHPLIRTGPGPADFRPATWDEALDLIASRMREVGREAVGMWQGHGNAANDYGVGLKRGQMERFANLYGCQRWNPAMICWGLGAFGLGLTGALETSTKEDMGDHSDMIVLWGANTVSQANTMRHVDRAKRRGARVVVIDVRRTEVGALADEVHLVRPGSDAALALGMMHVILAEGLHDRGFVAAHTLGIDALASHVAAFAPEKVAAMTGIAADAITGLARRYAATRRAMIVIGGSSMHKSDNGWLAARAIGCLPGLTGAYGTAGGGIGPRHGARSHGAGFGDITAADRRPPGDYVPDQMEAIVQSLEDRRVRVFMALGANVLSSFPDTGRMRAALAGTRLNVVYDIFMNQTARELADVILPGTVWLEEIGAKATNTHVYLCEPALPPLAETRPLFALYQGLAARLGVPDVYPWADQAAALEAVLDHPATGHATVAGMRANGGRAALRISHVGHPTRHFATASGRLEFRSDRAAAMGLPALPVPAPPPLSDALPLILTFGRTYAHFHSFYDSGRALQDLAARATEPEVWIAPQDAQARGIANGDAIEIHNERGRFAARANVTRRMRAGAVWTRTGWPGLNTLTDGAAVLPAAALTAFAFGVGQSSFGARVDVMRMAGAPAASG
ncbi:MAG: molybdopterin-dependent oxidoreductase [Rhodobacteraceae bacterium]|nr:molybdopterin-dependent oxidoreductase [Paracoccaceae bacterium]